jgi:hypothetical protein
MHLHTVSIFPTVAQRSVLLIALLHAHKYIPRLHDLLLFELPWQRDLNSTLDEKHQRRKNQ